MTIRMILRITPQYPIEFLARFCQEFSGGFLRACSRSELAHSTNSASAGAFSLRRIWLAQEVSGNSLPKLAHAAEMKEANDELKSFEAPYPVMMRHNSANRETKSDFQ